MLQAQANISNGIFDYSPSSLYKSVYLLTLSIADFDTMQISLSRV